MTEDSAAVQFNDDPPSEPGPAVDISGIIPTGQEWGWDDPTVSYNDSWVTDIGKDQTLDRQREEVQTHWDQFRRHVVTQGLDETALWDGVEKVYSTSRAAAFFGRSTQWMYWGLRKDPKTGEHPFSYKDGTPITPERVPPLGKRLFTLPIIREIALSCYRRGNLTEEELEQIMEKILLAEFGKSAFSDRD